MDSLAQSGWRLRPDWTQTAASAAPKDVLIEALNADLKDIGDAVLGDLVAAASAESGSGSAHRAFVAPSSGGIVLQISKIRNVSAPKANEESGGAPRMLKLSLTDGHSVVQGVEVSKMEKLSMATPPGTKVRLRPACQIPYVNGFLQLTPQCLEVLGGRVEPLVEKWEISRKLAQFTRAKPMDVGGPPSWVPFGKKIAGAAAQTLALVDKNFKALADKQQQQQESKESAEFDSQRQDAIVEAAKQGGKKVFGGGKAEIKEASAGHHRRGYQRGGANNAAEGDAKRPLDDGGEDASRGGGGRRGRGGRGRRNGDDDGDDSYGHAKPTSGVSLFDFLEKEFPGAHDVEKKSKGSNDTTTTTTTTHHDASHSSGRRRDDYNSTSHRPNYGDRGGEDRRGQQDHQRRGGRGGGGGEGRSDYGGRGSHRGGRGDGGSAAHNYGGGRSERYQNDAGKRPQQEDGSNRRHQDQNRRENAPRFQPSSVSQKPGGNNYHQSEDGSNNRRRGDGKRGGSTGGGERGGGDRGRGGGGGSERPGDRAKSAKQQTSTSDRDFGEWSNSTYHDSAAQRHQQPRPQQQQQQHHDKVSAGFEGMHLNDVDQRRQQQQKFERPPRTPQQQVGGGGNAHQQEQQQQQLQFQKPPPQIYQKPNAIQWKEGATCLAKYWEDGGFYTSRITALTPNTAVVLFQEYGNHEEVLLSDLKPMGAGSRAATAPQTGGGGGRGGGPFIAATPGLPPAFPQS